MTRAALCAASLTIGVVLSSAMRTPDARADAASARHVSVSGGTVGQVLAAMSIGMPGIYGPGTAPNAAAVRAELRAGAAGTYIADILRERDSSLSRWPDRDDTPLAVWIQPSSDVEDFAPEYVEGVREAFDAWASVDIPVQFAFVDDSAQADVHVRWIDHFDEPISGRTRWSRDDTWTITDANIVLAVHHHDGELLDQDAMHAMALHEVGHLLGLDHTTDSTSIMAPRVRVRRLSDADRSTVRLLYRLPAGPLR
jgi:predicted Zn-dependent protease